MEPQTTTARVGLKWGLIAGIVSMVYTAILYTTGLFLNPGVPWVGVVLSVVLIVLAMRNFRELNGGFMTYGEGVSMGAFTGTISALLSGSFNYLYTTFIDPTIQQQIRDFSEEQLAAQGMTDEQIEQALEFANTFQSPGVQFLMGVGGAVLASLIIALIASAFLRRERPFSEFQ